MFVNGAQTRCEVPTEWWSWQVDIATRTRHGQPCTIIRAMVQCRKCLNKIGIFQYVLATVPHEVPQQITSGVLKGHIQKIAPHFLSHATCTRLNVVRGVGALDCAQWSWTVNDCHCYLHAVHCGEDTGVRMGIVLRALASHKARHVHVYTARGGATSSLPDSCRTAVGCTDSFVGCGSQSRSLRVGKTLHGNRWTLTRR